MKIGLYGDSTQLGLSVWSGDVSVARVTPSAMLQMMLDHSFGAGVHQVRNYGIGGTTISGALSSGTMFPEGNLLQKITAQADNIVVANYGVNDAFLSSYTAAQHKANFSTLRDHVISTGGVFIYETPNPINEVHDVTLSALNDAVKSIAGLSICAVRENITGYYPQWQSHMSDGIHPNEIMYQYIGQMLYSRLSALVH